MQIVVLKPDILLAGPKRKIEEKIMKKSLLVALLLLPLAFAKASFGSQILPEEVEGDRLSIASRIVPIPDCYPCCQPGDWNCKGGSLTIASRIVPSPSDYPVKRREAAVSPSTSTTAQRNLIAPVRALRREA